MEHLSNPELQAFLQRELPPVQLLEADDHLATCPTCQAALAHAANTGPQIASLQHSFSPAQSHLDYEQLLQLAEGNAVFPDLENHLANCNSCRRELVDLRSFIAHTAVTPRSLQTPPTAAKRARVYPWRQHPVWSGLAAAALIAGIAVLYWRTSLPASNQEIAQVTVYDGDLHLSLDQRGRLRGAEALPPNQQAALNTALSTGHLPIGTLPSFPGRKNETMLGAPNPAAPFKVLSPVNRVVKDDRPTFSWEPFPRSTAYRVKIYAPGYRKVAESPLLQATSWQSSVSLPRNQLYTWTVTAESPHGEVREPAPPQPEAVFQVMSADAAAEIDTALSNHASDHLQLAVLYSQAGAVDEARTQLDLLAAQNPDSPIVAQLKASLNQTVPSPIKTNAAQ